MSVNKNEVENLRGQFETFVKSVTNLLSSKEPAYSMITKISREPEGHGLVIMTERKLDLVFLKSVFWSEIIELQSSSDCISAIDSSPIFKEILNTNVYISHFPCSITSDRILDYFLETYLEKQTELNFNKENFSLTFNIMLNSIIDDFVEIETFIPIEQFSMDDESIELIDGWRIERVPDNRLGELVPELHKYGERLPDLYNIRFALVRISKEKREVVKKGKKRLRRMTVTTEPIHPDIIMTALRVLKKGFCSLGDWRVRPLGWLFQRHSTKLGFRGKTNIMFPFMSRGYHLSDDGINELKELITRLNSLAKKEELEIPISRFNYGIEREDAFDQLIDYMIALESLYLKENDELALRFSLRIATFLARDEREHSEIYDLMSISYSIRSKIVHGVKWKKITKESEKRGYPIGNLVERVEEILRKSITNYAEYIDSDHSVKQIIEMIDASIQSDVPFFRV